MLGNMFHTPKAKKFYIPPRFYDPDKEERELREKRIRQELGLDQDKSGNNDGNYQQNIKGTFRVAQGSKSHSTNDARNSNRTRLIIFLVILGLLYLVFYKFNFTFFK